MWLPSSHYPGYQEYQSFVVTRNIVVNQGSVKISPAVVGAEFYRNDFSEIIRWVLPWLYSEFYQNYIILWKYMQEILKQ